MSTIHEVPCGKHGNILIQATQTDELTEVSSLSSALGSAFKDILDMVNTVCRSFSENLCISNQKQGPKKCSVEFGVQISTGGRAFIVEASSQASFKVLFEWDL